MSIARVEATLDFIEASTEQTGRRGVEVTLHGGEALTAEHHVLEAILEGLRRRFGPGRVSTSLQSNLWLLDTRHCELFREHQVEVGTSLDGPHLLNDRQRGAGYFAKTMAGIELARAHGLDVGCVATFTSLSAPHWREVFDFFSGQGLSFSLRPAIPPPGRRSGLELEPWRYGRLLVELLDHYLDTSRDIMIPTLDQFCRAVARRTGQACTFSQDCFGSFMVIDPLGRLYPCQRFVDRDEFQLGTTEQPPSPGAPYGCRAAARFLERAHAVRGHCGKCPHFAYCGGGCPSNAWSTSGDRDPVDPYCASYRAIFGHIARLFDAEMSSAENVAAIAEHGLAKDGHPLVRVGRIRELARTRAHPARTARSARRIVAAVELARSDEIDDAARRLLRLGLGRSPERLNASLRLLREHLRPQAWLGNFYLHVTFACQLQCTHCYSLAGPRCHGGTDEMSLEAVARLVDEAAHHGFRKVVITGGEPMLHSEREGLLRLLAERRRRIASSEIALRTNFSLPLTDSELELIAMAADHLIVSVDGGPHTHDARRGTGSYAQLVRNLESFTRWRNVARPATGGPLHAELSLAATLSAADVRSNAVRQVRELARRLGVARVRFRPLLPLGRARSWVEPSAAFYCHEEPLETIEHGFSPSSSCGLGHHLFVQPTGESFPCYALHQPGVFLGNAVTDGLSRVVTGQAFLGLRCRTVDSNKKCQSCEVRYLCGGACRAWIREAERADPDPPPVACDGLEKRARDLHRTALRYLGLTD